MNADFKEITLEAKSRKTLKSADPLKILTTALKISNYISFKIHLYRNNEKSYIRNTLGAYLFSKVHICDAKIAYLDDIANLEILPYGLHFSEVIY